MGHVHWVVTPTWDSAIDYRDRQYYFHRQLVDGYIWMPWSATGHAAPVVLAFHNHLTLSCFPTVTKLYSGNYYTD